MPERMILHIGMHKTGTTAIQTALQGYDDGAIRMARLGPSNHSIPMLTCFAADPTRYHVWVRQGLPPAEVLRKRDQWLAMLGDELALPRAALVISGEEMSLMRPASVGAMLDHLRPRAGALQVLGWLRPAASYVASAFQQQIRAGQRTLDLPRPQYRDRFGPYLDLCGGNRLELRLYDPARLAGGSAVADFCAAVGITAGAVAETTENTSISDDALRLVYRLNRDGPPTTGTRPRMAARARMLRHLAGRFAGRFTLPDGVAVAGIDPADLAWAEGLTGFALGGGATGDPSRGAGLLRDWMEDLPASAADKLDEDIAILRIRLPAQAGISEKLAALYQALLDEAEAQMALAPVFAAGRRGPPRAGQDGKPDTP